MSDSFSNDYDDHDDHDDRQIAPITTSLHDYQVSIDPELRNTLTEQLLPLHNDDIGAARSHMTRILASLKLPPSPSLCRINWIQASSREEVMESIRSNLNDNWELSDAINLTVQPHDQLSDVVEIHASALEVAAVVVVVDDVSSSSSTVPPPLSLLKHSIPRCSNGIPEALFTSWPSRQQLGWPMTHRVVTCDRFCSEAVLRGSHIFVKGIISADSNIGEAECVAVYGYVGCDRKKPTRGSNVMDVMTNNNANIGPYLFLGLGKTHCPRAQFFSSDSGIGVSMTLHRAGPILPPLHSIGKIHCMMQNLPSIVVGHALDPQPGDTILDMCCAPGGKTTHIASLVVGGKATIVACDRSRSKIVGVRDLVRKMGAEDCVIPLVLDATKCVIFDNDRKQQLTIQELLASADRKEDGLLDVAGFPPESFDRILLDPPCTALGLRPKLAIPLKAKELVKCAAYQRLFLHQAITLLKPGGILTYSTCTINALENETNVAHVLQEYNYCMHLLPLRLQEGAPLGSPGLTGHGLSEEQRTLVRRFDPADQRDNCMGFFVAKFEKRIGCRKKHSTDTE